MRHWFFIFFLLFSQFSFSKESTVAEKAEVRNEESDSPKESWTERMIDGDIAIAEWFDGVAEGIDLFLAGKKLTKAKNPSKLRLEELIASTEGKEVTHDFSLGVLLRLPNVEQYWQVRFTTYDEQEERRRSQTAYLRQTSRQENYGATIGAFRKLGNVRVAFQPRIQLKDPLSISHSLSYESVADMKKYTINPKVELYAVADKGTGVYWALNFNINLTPKLSLTFLNNGDYVAQLHLESVTNGFSFGQIITDTTAISYGTNFLSNNQPHYHLEGYSFFTSWSQTFYNKILDYSLTPHLDFNRSDSWHGRAGIALNLGLNF